MVSSPLALVEALFAALFYPASDLPAKPKATTGTRRADKNAGGALANPWRMPVKAEEGAYNPGSAVM
jgi:hypothetical protein